MKQKSNRFNLRNPKKLLAAGALLLLIIAGVGWRVRGNESASTNSPVETAVVSESDEDVNYDPPTKEEKDATDSHKKDLGDQVDDHSSTDNDGTRTATPHITSWDVSSSYIEVNGFVEGVVEDSGTCTLSLTKGSKTVTASEKGIDNVSTTTCGLLRVSRSKVSSGTWKATIKYSSSKAEGVSEALDIEVE